MGKTLYNKEILINQIRDYVEINDKPPTSREMKKQGYAGIHTFINHFGSFKNALIESGVFELREDKQQFSSKRFTDEELLEYLKEYMKDKDRIPKQEVMRSELKFPNYPNLTSYERRFYSIFNALKLIGYDYEKQNQKDIQELEEDMLVKYKQIKNELERVPTSRDIHRYSKKNLGYYSMSAYKFHFGSLHKLQEMCGYISTGMARNKTNEELINDLKELHKELGRTPTQREMKCRDNIAGYGKYTAVFGSWNKALLMAGLDVNSKIYYSTNGLKCLSFYELLFTNMLEKYNIEFTKENYYSEFMKTKRRFRFDFVISLNNTHYFIEIFGIKSNDFYSDRTKLKKELCLLNNINLIELYPEDFTSSNLDELHKILIEKILSN